MKPNKEREESIRRDDVGGGKPTSSNPQPEKDYTKAIVILIIIVAIVSSIFTLS